MGESLVFVGGLHKSGTSLLTRCLTAHPQVSGFHDTGVPEDEGQHLQDVYRAASGHGGPGRFAFDPEAHLTEASALVTVDARERLLAQWAPWWDADAPVRVEKSPPNLIRTRFLQALFPHAMFVLIVRHPLAVALATQKWSGGPVDRLLDHWFRAHEILAEDLPFLRRATVVRYEQLVAEPQATLHRVGEMVGLAGLSPQHVVGGLDRRYLDGWRADERTRAAIAERYAGAAMAFGYRL